MIVLKVDNALYERWVWSQCVSETTWHSLL